MLLVLELVLVLLVELVIPLAQGAVTGGESCVSDLMALWLGQAWESCLCGVYSLLLFAPSVRLSDTDCM